MGTDGWRKRSGVGWEGGKGYRGVEWNCQKELSRRTKLRVYNAIVVHTLVYGSETWLLNKQQELAIQAVEMRVLR